MGKFDDAVRKLKTDKKVPAWPSPDVMEFMGAKDALTKIRNMNIGMPDTGTYFEAEDFAAGFKKSMAFGRRVVKQPTASLVLKMCRGRTSLREKRQMQQRMATSSERRLQRCWVLLECSLANVSRQYRVIRLKLASQA